ncbi:MAG: trigger factor [Desulfohalobiaceae bacterium]|nr:trigger factor [Desulfohalobiaceae bacterium]
MEYQVEDVNSVKKQVSVQVGSDEINAAIGAAVAMQRKDLKLSGFRQGKVPGSLVEQKFKKEIYNQAAQDLLNVHFSQILGEIGLEPLGGVDVDAGPITRDQDYRYSFSFEFVPEIDLPEYHGLQAEKRKPVVSEEMVNNALERIRFENSTLELVKEERHPRDGDVAVIDFAAFQNGQPLENIKQDKFELPLGEAQALSDFEEIVKGLLPGQSGEGEVTFPDDFINQDLAGQTVTMQVHLNVIKERVLPAVDEELAQKVAGHGSVESLRKQIEENFHGYFENMEKSRVQKKLLDQLSAKTDFALPETMVERQLDGMLENKQKRLEQEGKSLEAEGSPEELKEKLRPEAEELVKNHLILLEIAKKEDLSISPQEVDQYLYQTAVRNRQDPEQLRKHYEDNNLMFALKDSLLADRAAEVLYEKAELQEIEPEESGEPEAAAETENPDESGSPDEENA